MIDVKADVCLILEGTYPFVSGGVSGWTHELINSQEHLTFNLLAIVPKTSSRELKYPLPKNVTGLSILEIQELPRGTSRLSVKESNNLFQSLEGILLNMQTHSSLKYFKSLLEELSLPSKELGDEILLNSKQSFNMLLHMYHASMGNTCFLEYFWSWRSLMSGMYSVLLSPLPRARCYHAISTGYAGLALARAHLETHMPCLLTEHGIYTNERRVEILLADWLSDQHSPNLNSSKSLTDRNLQDFWVDTFRGYSKVAYACAKKIVTLFDGNFEFQLADGADREKMITIPNGIEIEKFQSIKKEERTRKTIAFIGRVVPIKDVKTYLYAVSHIKKSIPDIDAYLIGPTDEDEVYFEECKRLISQLGLESNIQITGLVDLTDYLGKIDVLVLTSLSEAQPLVILEAGACGVVTVATHVGSCKELLYGGRAETPNLGQGGIICPLSNPEATAESVLELLMDPTLYAECSAVIKARIKKYYNCTDQRLAYKELYSSCLSEGKWQVSDSL